MTGIDRDSRITEASAGDDPSAIAAALFAPERPPPPAIGAGQKRRFGVYRNNVAHGLIEALRSVFPAVERLVGEEFFAALAHAHVVAEPPRAPMLFTYGGGFAPFLESFPPVASLPYLADVARLEWLRMRAYHAADISPAPIAALAEIAPEALADAGLTPHPTLGLVRSRWPVFSLWAASVDADGAPEIDLDRAEDALVSRPALTVETRLPPSGGGAFVAALLDGQALGAAARAGMEDAARAGAGGKSAFDLAAHLTGLFSSGAVAGITMP